MFSDDNKENNSDRSNSTAIPIYRSNQKLSKKQVDELVPFRLPYRWVQKPEFGPLASCIAVDPDTLYFIAQWDSTPNFDKTTNNGEFKEGLWEKDAAEFFILDDKNDSYQEFNLSPAGAWWTSLFNAYRKNDNSYKVPEEIGVHTENLSDAIRTTLTFPRSKLGVSCSFRALTLMNLCGTVTEPNNRFVSWAEIETNEPDFHKVVWFERIGFKDL